MSWVDAHLFKFTLHLRHYWLDYKKAEKVSLKFCPFLDPMVLLLSVSKELDNKCIAKFGAYLAILKTLAPNKEIYLPLGCV